MKPRTLKLPSYERVREVFDYDPLSGVLTSKISTGARRQVGTKAGYMAEGRIHVGIDGKTYKAHRIIWLWMTGAPPPDQIDHEDLDASNNRWSNLRLATNSQNNANRRTQSNKKSHRLKGAYRMWNGTWYSRICFHGEDIYLGVFDTPEEAHAAHALKSRELFGEFARAA